MPRKKKVTVPELTREELEAAKSEMNIISTKVADLRLQNDQFAHETAGLESKMEEARKAFESMEANVENLRREEERLLDGLNQKRTEIVGAEDLRNAAMTERDGLLAEVETLRKEHAELSKELAEEIKRDEAMRDEQAKREESLSRRERTLVDVEEQLDIRQALLERREALIVDRAKAGL